MSMITLFSAFMGLYVIVRLILPSGMNWPLKLILSLFALACAEKLLLTKLVYGTMGAFMPEPVQLASGYLHSAVAILFLLLVARDALLLLTWPFRRSTGRQRKIFYGHKEKKPIGILGLHAGAARAGPVRLRYAGSPAGPSRA